MPHVPLELREIDVLGQRAALDDLDAALVRLPVDGDDDLHVIPLYDELPVVVVSAESVLTAAEEEITIDDLAGEVVIVPADDVLGIQIPDAVAPAFAPPTDTAEAIATVAAGVGVAIVPMSLARAHQRRDVEYRVLAGGPVSTVALAWRRDATTEDVETFVGIVRGRTARSSR
jgi:DNA-binding transcriptional LysR family regulator